VNAEPLLRWGVSSRCEPVKEHGIGVKADLCSPDMIEDLGKDGAMLQN
jgi:hypothetical protein